MIVIHTSGAVHRMCSQHKFPLFNRKKSNIGMKPCQMLVTTQKIFVSLLSKRCWTCEGKSSAKGTRSHSTIFIIILHIMYFMNDTEWFLPMLLWFLPISGKSLCQKNFFLRNLLKHSMLMKHSFTKYCGSIICWYSAWSLKFTDQNYKKTYLNIQKWQYH